jgi:hypothetical protein
MKARRVCGIIKADVDFWVENRFKDRPWTSRILAS